MKYILKRNIVKHFYNENKACFTTKILQDMSTALDNSIGVNGDILATCVGFLIEQHKNIISGKNKRSQKLFIKWLFSEMRFYNDLGTLNPYVNCICKRIIKLMMERLQAGYRKASDVIDEFVERFINAVTISYQSSTNKDYYEIAVDKFNKIADEMRQEVEK